MLAGTSSTSLTRQVGGAGVPGEHGRALVARHGRARSLGDLADAGVGGTREETGQSEPKISRDGPKASSAISI
jgi:hypothetical protein